MGSTHRARRTGTIAAARQTPVRARKAKPIERGSVSLRPNNIALNKRAAAIAKKIPATLPTASSTHTSRVTIQIKPSRGAPNAMRTPISLVRPATLVVCPVYNFTEQPPSFPPGLGGSRFDLLHLDPRAIDLFDDVL